MISENIKEGEAEEGWYEVFGLNNRGPSIEVERRKMIRFQKHLFLKF
jgi:hypothetical protein